MRVRILSAARPLPRVVTAIAVASIAVAVPLTITAAPAAATPAPFTCAAPTDFTSPNGNQLVAIPEGSTTATKVGGTHTPSYNALAFDQADHYLYAITEPVGTAGNVLVQIDSTGAVTPLATVSGLPAMNDVYSYASGTFDADGVYWVTSNDPNSVTAYGIDVATRSVTTTVTLSEAVAPADWTFARGYLWSLDGTTLTRVDPSTGNVTTRPVAGSTSTAAYNAAWTYADGSLAFVRSTANQLLHVTLAADLSPSTATVTLSGDNAYGSSGNDGASCAPAIGITFDGTPGTVGVAYDGHLAGTGGSAPYTWSLVDGALPEGLQLDTTSGDISGSPTTAGTFAFTVAATDSAGQVGQHAESITIYPGPFSCSTPTILLAPSNTSTMTTQLYAVSTGASPQATALGAASGIAYNAMAFNRADRNVYAISAPYGSESSNHLVRIDSGGNVFDLGAVSSLPPVGLAGLYDAAAFDASGTFWITHHDDYSSVAYGIDIATRSVVHVVTLDAPFDPSDWTAAYGYLWGEAAGDIYQVDLSSGHVTTASLGMTSNSVANAIWTNADSSLGFVLAPSSTNTVYRLPVQAGPLTDASLGQLTSTTVASSSALFSTDDDGTACLPSLSLSTAPGTTSGEYGHAYSGAVQATGGTGPYTWNLASGALPDGLAVGTDGTITGTPTSSGTFSFSAQVTDTSPTPQSATIDVTIDVAKAPLTITASSPSMLSGAAVPTVSPSYSGFISPDGPGVLTADPTCGTDATSSSSPGTYPTYCSGASAPNYAIAYVPGSLTIVQGYRTSGFLSPVSNSPTVNTGKAGRTYPLKWQVQDAAGNYVTSLSVVRSVSVRSTSCSAFSGDPSEAVQATTTGGTSLRYDTAANQFVYNWQTSARGCFSVFVTLTSGQVLSAFFNLS